MLVDGSKVFWSILNLETMKLAAFFTILAVNYSTTLWAKGIMFFVWNINTAGHSWTISNFVRGVAFVFILALTSWANGQAMHITSTDVFMPGFALLFNSFQIWKFEPQQKTNCNDKSKQKQSVEKHICNFILKCHPELARAVFQLRGWRAAGASSLRSCYSGGGGGRAGFVLRADRREQTQQGRWRPRGPPNGLADRLASLPAGPVPVPALELGAGPGLGLARQRTKWPSAQRAWRLSPAVVRPADTRPVRSAWPGDTPATRSGSGGGVTPRAAAAAGREGGTVTAREVGVFTVQTTAHIPLHQHRRWLFVQLMRREKNIETSKFPDSVLGNFIPSLVWTAGGLESLLVSVR